MDQLHQYFEFNVDIPSISSGRVSVIRWIGEDVNTGSSSNQKSHLNGALPTVLYKQDLSSLSSSDSGLKRICIADNYQSRSHWKSTERRHPDKSPAKFEHWSKTRSDGLRCQNHGAQNASCFPNEAENLEAKELLSISKEVKGSAENISHQNVNVSRSQTGRKLFTCHMCNRDLFSSVGMMKHFQAHKERSDHKCKVCNRMFTKRSALDLHRRVHTGEKPFLCNICKKAFSINGNLKRHLFTHSGERPYKCLKCSQCFNNQSHLKRHMQNKHKKAMGDKS